MNKEKFEAAAAKQLKFFEEVLLACLKKEPEYDIENVLHFMVFELEDRDDVVSHPVPRIPDVVPKGVVTQLVKGMLRAEYPREFLEFKHRDTDEVVQGISPPNAVMHWSGCYNKNPDGTRNGEEGFSFYMEDRNGNWAMAQFAKNPGGPTLELVLRQELFFGKLSEPCGAMQNYFDINLTEEVAN